MTNNELLNDIKRAAELLKGSRMKNMAQAEPVLKDIQEKLSLESQEEAIIMVAIFDRQCGSCDTDIQDLSRYFECPTLEVIQYISSIKSLWHKGYLKADSSIDDDKAFVEHDFRLEDEIFIAIASNKEIAPKERKNEKISSPVDFCRKVHDFIDARSENRLQTSDVFEKTERLENENHEFQLVKNLKAEIKDIPSRVFFYEMCNDFTKDYDGGVTGLNHTLKDIYDDVMDGLDVMISFQDYSHELINKLLISITNNESVVRLTSKGIKLFLGEKAAAYINNNKCKERYDFVGKINDYVDEMPSDVCPKDVDLMLTNLESLENENRELAFVKKTKNMIYDGADRIIFYQVCYWANHSRDFDIEDMSRFLPNSTCMEKRHALKDEKSPLILNDLVQVKKGRFFNKASLVLTERGKELFFEKDADLFVKDEGLNCIECKNISKKQLFFEPAIESQLNMLANCLEDENFQKMCERLKSRNMPTGVTALLYGLPGTGKTESVLQMARLTGRNVMHVDIASSKSCWFGESEKIIKQTFDDYRKLCQDCKVKPILLFNEADAIFSKRKDISSSSVAQTENAIQNIILEEMEKLDGILIATTNMTDNLDAAFDRRFLFKIRFDKPTLESRVSIWKDKIPLLSEEDATRLASAYDFSGGEIDNIARKAAMSEVISGHSATIDDLLRFCSSERLGKAATAKIGF
jgi:hypothetical protein